MKARTGFVSNSSSSSFIVDKAEFTDSQFELLNEICSKPIGIYQDSWEIWVDNENKIHGFTIIDNGGKEDGLYASMLKYNLPVHKMKWEDY